jgi:hypothetical protein
MSKKVLLIPVEDLKELEIICPNPECKHPFVFRLLDGPARSYFPSQCPHCRNSTMFAGDPSALGTVLHAYIMFCSRLKEWGLTPQFRLTVDNP